MIEMKMYFSKLPDSRDNRGLKHGVSSADTLFRVFALIEHESFMEMFYCWIQDVLSTFQKIMIPKYNRWKGNEKSVFNLENLLQSDETG